MKSIDVIRRLQDHLDNNTLDPNMPMFVLWGCDRAAPEAVRFWSHGARIMGTPDERCNDALLIAKEMDEWPVKQVAGCPETRCVKLLGEVD